MKIVLIGGGYIASNFAEKQKSIDSRGQVIQLDLSDGSLDITKPADFSMIKKVLDGAVIHIFAAISSDPAVTRSMEVATQVNLTGLANFLEFTMRQCSPSKVIFSSSEWVYGDTITDGMVNVSQLTSCYARQKVAGEILTEQFGLAYNIPTVIARFGIVWGNRVAGSACENIALEAAEASRAGKTTLIVGHRNSARRFIHIDDLAYALTKLSEEPSGIYDLTGQEIVSIQSIVEACGALLKTEFKLEETSPRPSRRCLDSKVIKVLSVPWHQESFENRMRQHFEQFFF
ncbi:NAD(P)-dependent oxidoreductase [Luminiphilus sp.]|nr:NAD(P)-dependent oxidoreductase [Luminiphilus sp.]